MILMPRRAVHNNGNEFIKTIVDFRELLTGGWLQDDKLAPPCSATCCRAIGVENVAVDPINALLGS